MLALSLLLALALSVAILVWAGVPAGDLFDEMVVETLLDAQNFQSVLVQAAPLMLVGVGAAMAFRVNFWNLGLEGQMMCGGIAATAVSLWHVGPDSLRLPLMAVAAAAAGCLWVGLPTWMKLRLGLNEIISTLLLNYIAFYGLLDLIYGPWKDPVDNFPHSPAFAPQERLPDLMLPGLGFTVNAALPLSFVLALLAWWLVRSTRFGMYMRFVQANARMSQAVGVKVRAITVGAVLISAALCGLAGFATLSGQEGRLTGTFYDGAGFSGILIAFLARNNPLGAVVVAVLIGMLFVSGQSLQVFYQIPISMVQLIEAIIVLFVAASEFFIRYRVRVVG